MKTLTLALSLTLALPARAAPQERLEEVGLTLTLPQLEDLVRVEQQVPDRIAFWTGTLDGCQVRIRVVAIERTRFPLEEPEELSALLEADHVRRQAEASRAADFGAREPVEGDFGHLPYASLAVGDVRERTAVTTRMWLLCGLGETYAWSVQVEAAPPPGAAGERALVAFLRKDVRAEGEPREWRWTEEEARARWVEFAPEDAVDKLDDVIRTDHYIVIGNASGGRSFARKMEQCYATIAKTFPFPDVEGRRLMPVFLFRTPDQYYQFFSKRAGIPLEQARRSKGHAFLDYYATWYEAPNDPVHIHEATHQIFGNRLYLSGGGSWFQEGVAEYIETRDNERNNAARLVKKGRHTKLRDFVGIPSLLMSAEEDIKGGNEAGDHYKQAALLIEFLRESRFGKARFMEFVNAVGRVPRNDVEAIDQVVQRIYGVDLDGLDAEWVDWAKKR